MALIKNAQSESIVRDAIVLDLAQIGRQADELIALARRRAQQIVDDAAKERDRLLSDAREIGRAAGHEAGFAQGLAEGRAQGLDEARAEQRETLAKLSESWSAALDRFERDRDDLLLHARTEALALALAVARRVTGRIVEQDPAVVGAQMERVLGLVTRPSRLTLRIHSDDLARAHEELPALASKFSAARHAELVPDDTVTRGSVVARTDRGVIDASIETQLDRIADALLPNHDAPAAPAAAEPHDDAPEAPPLQPPQTLDDGEGERAP